MPVRTYTFSTPKNPIVQVLYFIIGGVMLIGAVLIGAVILSFALGIALIVALIVYVRIWWLRRKFGQSGRGPGGPAGSGGAREGEVLEVEYSVVRERKEHDD